MDVDAGALVAVLGRRIGELEVQALILQLRLDDAEAEVTRLKGAALPPQQQ